MHSYKSSKVDTSETNIFSNVSQCPSQLDFVTLYYFLLSVYTVVCVVTSNLDRDPIITFQAPSPESTCASTSRDSTNTSQSRYFRSMMSFNTNKCSKSGTRRKCCRCTALKNIFLSLKIFFYMIVLQKIKHPFLISLSDVWKDNHNLYFLFPFHCGGELFTFMRMYDR